MLIASHNLAALLLPMAVQNVTSEEDYDRQCQLFTTSSLYGDLVNIPSRPNPNFTAALTCLYFVMVQNDTDINLDDELRVVVIGRTGAGISSVANNILGKPAFERAISLSSRTTKSGKDTSEYAGRRLLVIDTPGMFNNRLWSINIYKELINAMHMTSPGPHAIIFTIKVGRDFHEEYKSFSNFIHLLGIEVWKYLIVVFTFKDELDREGSSEEYYVNGLSDNLKKEIRIVLVGHTGNGKSATGNTIIGKKNGKDAFRARLSASSITQVCQIEETRRDNKKIIVIDTPGLYPTNEKDNEKTLREIRQLREKGKEKYYTDDKLKQIERELQETDMTLDERRRNILRGGKCYNIVKKWYHLCSSK
ncbi:GTPase IMAP family member 7-like [Mytilus trossulus]|uniref:GTPase IMAP family member 7-like n=1 Tax=Mytilus trossulus TaxID=6551 RepID=UPI0030053B43